MVKTWTHGIEMDSWYRHGLVVLTTPMVLTKTHDIELLLLNHPHTRGPSVARMRRFLGIAAIICTHQDNQYLLYAVVFITRNKVCVQKERKNIKQ